MGEKPTDTSKSNRSVCVPCVLPSYQMDIKIAVNQFHIQELPSRQQQRPAEMADSSVDNTDARSKANSLHPCITTFTFHFSLVAGLIVLIGLPNPSSTTKVISCLTIPTLYMSTPQETSWESYLIPTYPLTAKYLVSSEPATSTFEIFRASVKLLIQKQPA